MNLLALSMSIYLVAAGVRLWRVEGARNQALLFTLGFAPFVLLAAPHGFAVNRGWVRPPVYYVFGFFFIVLTMSYVLMREVVRSVELDREVSVKERRWRSLLDSFSLLALGCDRDGRIAYVNPCLLRTTGYGEGELLGKPFGVLFPPEELPGPSRGLSGGHGRRSESVPPDGSGDPLRGATGRSSGPPSSSAAQTTG